MFQVIHGIVARRQVSSCLFELQVTNVLYDLRLDLALADLNFCN